MNWLKSKFIIPADQTVTETGLLKVLATSSVSMLLCLACLVSTTWAWFSVSVTSQGNVMQMAAAFSVDVQVAAKSDQTTVVSSHTITGGTDINLTQGSWIVTLTVNPGSEATKGYCIVEEGTNSYHSLQFAKNTDPQGVQFPVDVAEEGVVLRITPFWGSYTAQEGMNVLGGDHSLVQIGTPTEPTAAPTEPSTVPTEPSIVPTEPSTAPTEPSIVPTEPSTAPTESSSVPTEPSTAPTESSLVPTEPSTAPTTEPTA